MLIVLIILSLLASIFPKTVFAESGINKFGIHILEPADLPKAQELVNSNGGDWGWVTIVIRDDDMSHDKWQGFMDECRVRHLIPLVRIATHLEGQNWAKPKIDDVNNWVNFLNSLNWPVSNRYVILFNEPNHAKEWGGDVNPREYVKILNEFISKYKILNTKYLILNSGFDLAAPNGKTTMDAYDFMKQMDREIPGIFEKLDGWVSHSYPNHGFLGKPWDNGKHSIKGYEWELGILKNDFMVKKELPVFITETGWPKDSSKFKVQSSKLKTSAKYYNEKIVSEYIRYAFENVWLKDEKVKAITPFVLNYNEDLFDDFSWLDKEGNPYPQFDTIKKTEKVNWWPEQEVKYELNSILLPPFLPANTKFNGELILKNIGQSILGEQEAEGIPVEVPENLHVSNLIIPNNQKIKPGEIIRLDFSITSTTHSGEYEFTWKNLPKQRIKVFPSSFISKARYNFWKKIMLKVGSIF